MYFEVQAKCGHVGRNNYIIKKLYIIANDAKSAAERARYCPRVKHNRKDAIIGVEKIEYEKYIEGRNISRQDIYFQIHNSSDQKRVEIEGIEREEYESNLDREKCRDVNYKLRKHKCLKREMEKMILGAYYGKNY